MGAALAATLNQPILAISLAVVFIASITTYLIKKPKRTAAEPGSQPPFELQTGVLHALCVAWFASSLLFSPHFHNAIFTASGVSVGLVIYVFIKHDQAKKEHEDWLARKRVDEIMRNAQAALEQSQKEVETSPGRLS